MRTRQYTVTARQVQQHTEALLARHLALTDHGPKCTASVLYALLCWAAARITSLAAACAALSRAPSDQAARDALLATLPAFAQLQRQLNRALAGDLPRILRCSRQRVALDLTLIPYYGEPYQDPAELYGGAAKAGTQLFHAYATAYVIAKGCRWTVALRVVHQGDAWDAIVRDLLRQAAKVGVKARLVLLDRGFYSVEVIRYLQAARYPFIMPVVRRGRSPKHPKGPSGTWVFFTWKRSGWDQYTLTQRRRSKQATVSIGVCCRWVRRRRRRRPEWGPRKREVWVYAYWGLQPSSLTWLRETYRLRFGIESSYRQLHQARIRTSTRQPLLRLLYVGVALLVRNVWVWLHWEVLAQRRQGRRRVDLGPLPFRALLLWLQRCIEEQLGHADLLPVQRPIPT
jgi:Transposase DDE domain